MNDQTSTAFWLNYHKNAGNDKNKSELESLRLNLKGWISNQQSLVKEFPDNSKIYTKQISIYEAELAAVESLLQELWLPRADLSFSYLKQVGFFTNQINKKL